GAEPGFGLEGLLRYRRDRRAGDLSGILNGIATGEWNPATDPAIAAPYDASTLDAKRVNRAALAKRLGLDAGDDTPVLGMVSRMTHQKGVDLVIAAAPMLVARGARLAVLGSGERAIETAWRE